VSKYDYLAGKIASYHFETNETMLWIEDEESRSLNVLSTHSLVEMVHKCGFEFLKEHLESYNTSVVIETHLKHFSPTPAGMTVNVKLKVEEVRNNLVFFSFEAFDEINKIAEGEFKRVIVSKTYLKRKINEKTSKIS